MEEWVVDLKPCLCGGKELITQRKPITNDKSDYSVTCYKCGTAVIFWSTTEEEVIKEWDRMVDNV